MTSADNIHAVLPGAQPSEETTLPLTRESGETGLRAFRALFATIGTALVGGLALLLLNRGLLPPKPVQTRPVPMANYPLQLAVAVQDDKKLLSIRWNPEIATQAREGRLTITENHGPGQTVVLTPQFLKTGHWDSQFPASHLDEIRLEIDDPSGTTTTESIEASSLRTLPAVATPRSVGGENTQVAKVTLPELNSSVGPAAIVRETPAIRRFIPPAPGQPSTGEHAVLSEPPSILTGSALPASTGVPVATVNLPAPVVRESPVIRQTTGDSVREASLIKKVLPTYPAFAKTQHVQGTVRFAATIAKDGTVKSIRVVSGPPVLVPSATEAVRKWLYKPAMVNGNPVEGTTQVEVTFNLSQ